MVATEYNKTLHYSSKYGRTGSTTFYDKDMLTHRVNDPRPIEDQVAGP